MHVMLVTCRSHTFDVSTHVGRLMTLPSRHVTDEPPPSKLMAVFAPTVMNRSANSNRSNPALMSCGRTRREAATPALCHEQLRQLEGGRTSTQVDTLSCGMDAPPDRQPAAR